MCSMFGADLVAHGRELLLCPVLSSTISALLLLLLHTHSTRLFFDYKSGLVMRVALRAEIDLEKHFSYFDFHFLF
jgi:hypothetical protein